MRQSLAYVETKGFVGAAEAADAMVKTAAVKILQYTKIGDAYVTVIIEGSLSDCQAAIESGSAAASRIGELISSGIIPRPLEDMNIFLPKESSKKRVTPSSQKNRSTSAAAAADLSDFIKNAENGITIDDLAQVSRQSKDKIRQMLKKMMDENRIEKVHKKYYWIS
jgi:microcompartment protein CcmL/EutN